MAVKLRKPIEVPVPDGDLAVPADPIPLKPLLISGVWITKDTLIEALRVYVPLLADVEVDQNGERFFLTLRPAGPGDPA